MKAVEFAVDPTIAARFPDLEILLVIAEGLANSTEWPEVEKLLEDVESESARDVGACVLDEADPRIASWFETYRSFGTNPKRTRPSVFALLKRLVNSGHLPRINGAVNAYNFVSIRFQVPAGAFDVDRLPGAVTLRRAAEGDAFTPLGEPDVVEVPGGDEIVYAVGSEVLTRHWNHRDSDKTRVVEETQNAVFILERVSGDPGVAAAVGDAVAQLVELLWHHCDAVRTLQLTASSPSASL